MPFAVTMSLSLATVTFSFTYKAVAWFALRQIKCCNFVLFVHVNSDLCFFIAIVCSNDKLLFTWEVFNESNAPPGYYE